MNLGDEDVPLGDAPSVEIGDGDVPLTDLPTVDLGDGDVPLASLPAEEEEELLELGDEEVPLAMLPATGDMMGLWLAMSGLSAAGVYLKGKKREDEE